MTKQVQRRRGTSTQHTSFAGAEGEISVNTTNKSVHVHDGSTAGGFEAARADLGNVSDANLNSALAGNTLSSLTITSADINGGTIDGTVIGGTTPAAGTFAQFDVTGKLTATNGTAGEPALYVDGAANAGWGLEINSHNAASASDLVLNGNAVLGTETSLSQTMPAGGYYRWMTGATSNTSGTAGATEVVRIDTSGLDVTGTITGTADATLSGLTVGRGAGDVSTNTAVGLQALQSNTTGAFNTAGGRQALRDTTTGTENTAYGYQALVFNVGGSFNTAHGYRTLFSNTSGANNTAVGLQALQGNTSGSSNVAVGANALQVNTIGNFNTAVGRQALAVNDTGNENTAQGYQALLSNAGGSNNTAQGFQALANNTSGSANTAMGRQALYSNTSGTSNTAVGREALQSNLTGNNNTAQGYLALKSNTSGVNNTAQGTEALRANTTGINNTAVGRDALLSNTIGGNNTAHGFLALELNTTGNNNLAVGRQALQSNTTGTFNTAVGRGAGSALTTGSNNTIVGSVAGEAGLADTVIIAAGEAERIRIDSNGNVGINTPSPDKMLHLSGGNALLQNATGNTAIAIVANNNTSLAGNKIAFFGAGRFEEDEEMAYIKPLLVNNNGGAGNVQLGQLAFGTSGEERMRFDSSGHAIIPGGVTLGTATGVYSAAKTLDDYEEGTWTPVITDGTNNATSDINVATYTKTGDHVHVQGRIRLSSLGAVSGALRLTGLPFTSKAMINNFGAMTVGRATGLNLTSGTTVCGDLRNNVTRVFLVVWDSTVGNTTLQATEFSSDGDISFSMDYLSN